MENIDLEQFDFQHDLSPDPEALDEEWLRHPGLFFRYSQALAIAMKARQKLNERKKTLRSQLIRQAAADPDGCLGRGVKYSDSKAEAYYRGHGEYKTAADELIEAEYVENMLSNAVKGMYQRRDALQDLVRLVLAEYFVAPTVPRELPGGRRAAEQARLTPAAEAQRTGLRRKRK